MSVCTATADPDVGQRAASTCSTGGTLLHKHCKVVGSVACFLPECQGRSSARRLLRRFLDCCRCIRHVFVRKRTGWRTPVSRSSLRGQKQQAAGLSAAHCLHSLSDATDKPSFGNVSTFVVNLRMLTEFRALEMVGGKLLTKPFQFTISSTAVVNTPGGVSFSTSSVEVLIKS